MYSDRDDCVLGTGSQGMTKPTSSCERPAGAAGSVCVGDGGKWDEGLAASAATLWLLGNGTVPTRLPGCAGHCCAAGQLAFCSGTVVNICIG